MLCLRPTLVDDYDLTLQLASRLQQIGDPDFHSYDLDHDGGDPAAIARGCAYNVDAIYHQAIETMTTERYLLCTNLLDCY